MLNYRFIEKDHQLVSTFLAKRGRKNPKPYFIAIGVFEDEELTGVMTFGKPNESKEGWKNFSFGLAEILFTNADMFNETLKGAMEYFHMTYDGLVQLADEV